MIRSFNLRALQRELPIGALLYPEKVERPRTRGECLHGHRPCPYVGCRYHLGSDVRVSGSLTLACDDPTELRESCALDVADAGGLTHQEIGEHFGLSRERIRQIEVRALTQLSKHKQRVLKEFLHG